MADVYWGLPNLIGRGMIYYKNKEMSFRIQVQETYPGPRNRLELST